MEEKVILRQEWVDIAKGIAILAVVLGHIGFDYPKIKLLPISDLLVWSWHVPVFFLIGGFFIKEDKLCNPVAFIKGKVKSLYFLILLLYVPVLLLHNWFINIGFYNVNIEYYGKFVTEWNFIEFLKNFFASIFCAGREPLLGAMWFVYVLFMALCLLSFVSFCLRKIIKEEQHYEYIRFGVFLLGAIVSCTLTNIFDFTIPRFNNTIVAIWLIYIGMLLKNKCHIKFTNRYIAIIAFIIVYYSSIVLGGVNMVSNRYSDVVSLTVVSASALYVICFLSIKMEKTIMGRGVAKIGKESFYIMGLHFIGFKIVTLLLISIGTNRVLAELVPSVGSSISLLMAYLLAGVLIPLLIVLMFRIITRHLKFYIKK